MNQKKICFIELQPFPSTIGGGTTHIAELSRALLQKGYEVSVISSPPEKKRFKLEEGLKNIKIYHVGIPHKKISDFQGIRKLGYYFWRLFFEFSFIIGAYKILQKEKFDVINAQNPVAASLPCSLFGKKFFITAHGLHGIALKTLYKEKKNWLVSNLFGGIYNLIEYFNVKKADKIICLGKTSFNHYHKLQKSVIIPNGVDTVKFKPSRKINNLIISVGRLSNEKNVDKLILAMDNLQSFKLEIIGLGPLEPKIIELCKKRKNCKFLGYKEHYKLPNFLGKARFIVIPSLYEGLPITMLEAMSCGCIPLVSHVGDIPDVIIEGKNGFFLKNINPKKIASSILGTKNKNLNSISKNARKTIEKQYGWETVASQYIKEYGI